MSQATIYRKEAQEFGKTLDFALNVKAEAVKADGSFEGYASIWNVVDQGGEAVQPGAFTEGLVKAKADGRLIPMLWQHNRTEPLGVWDDMSEDAKGLWVAGSLLVEDCPLAKRAHALLKRKAIGGLSIGYRIPEGGAAMDEKRRGVLLLKKLSLVEVSLVTMPMLIQAKVTAVKSVLEAGALPTVREFEGFLRDAGFPKEKAVAMASACSSLLRGEPGAADGPDAVAKFADALIANLKSKGF